VPTLTDRDEGTSNVERIAIEVERAAWQLSERTPDYRDRIAKAAIECFILTAEHDEQRININQKYDELIKTLAHDIGSRESEALDS
jgi:hypothetical protein